MPGTHVHTTVARIYRRSHAGYACTYDSTDIYREDEGREEGRNQKVALKRLKIGYV